MSNKSGGGKAAVGVLSFFIGFIICLIIEAAVVFGFGYWAYTTDLNKLFDLVGVDNTTEEEGETKYVYVDTSVVSSLKDLISQLSDVADKGTAMTLADLDFLPIISTTVDDIYSALADALNLSVDEIEEILDKDGLMNTALSDLGDYIMDCVYGIKVETVLNIAVEDWEENNLYLALAYGSQAGTVEVNGAVYYLYYDTFECDDSDENDIKYYRTEDSAEVSGDYIYNGATADKVYYYVNGAAAYIVTRDSDGYTLTNIEYSIYDSSIATLSGDYYMNGNEIVLIVEGSERTLGDILEDDGVTDLLYDIYISDLGIIDESDTSGSTGSTDLLNIFLDALADVSLGELLYDNVDLSVALDGVLITDLLASDDELISSVFEGISLGDLLSEDFDFEGLVNDIYAGQFLEADPDNSIMAYIGYSVTGLEQKGGTLTYTNDEGTGETLAYSYTATLHLYDEDNIESMYDACITLDESGNISGVYYYDTATDSYEYYGGVTIGEISDQAGRLTTDVKIKDLMDLSSMGDSALADKLGEYTIDNIGDFLNELTLADALGDVSVEGDSAAIMDYIVYGLTNVSDTGRDYNGYSVYSAKYNTYDSSTDSTDPAASYNNETVYLLVDGDGNICEIYSKDDIDYETDISETLATPVNNVNDRMDGIMEVLTLADVMGEVEVGDDSSSTIMMYVVYGITDLSDQSIGTATIGTDTFDVYKATYHSMGNDDEFKDCNTVYALVYTENSKSYIYGVYTDDTYTTAIGTPINAVSDRMDGIMEVLTLADVMGEVEAGDDSSSTIMMYVVYGITDLSDQSIGTATIGTDTFDVYEAVYNDIDGETKTNPVYVLVYNDSSNSEKYNTIYAVYTTYDKDEKTYSDKIKGTSIDEVNARMNNLMSVLYLSDVMGDVSTTDDSFAIMAYLVYGVSSISDTLSGTTTINGTTFDVYEAVYNDIDGETKTDPVYVLVYNDSNSEKYNTIYAVYKEYDGSTYSKEIKGTLVNNVSDRMNGLMSTMTIGELVPSLTTSTTSPIAQKLADVTIDGLSEFLDTLTLADVMDPVSVEGDSAVIMEYLVYGLTNVTYYGVYDSDNDVYSATYNPIDTSQSTYTVYTKVDSATGNILEIYEENTCETDITSTVATLVNDVNERMSGIMGILTLADVMGDVSIDSDSFAIMAYLVYGVSSISDTSSGTTTINGTTFDVYEAVYNDIDGETKTDPVYVLVYSDSNNGEKYNTIYAVYKEYDGSTSTYSNEINGTPVNDVNSRMNGLMSDLTIGEIADLGTSSIAQKLSDKKINELGTFLNDLTLADAIGEVEVSDETSSKIMMYIVYGISDLGSQPVGTTAINGTTYDVYKATYHSMGDDDEFKDCDTVYALVYTENSKSYIYGVYTDNTYTTAIGGTPVSDISDRMGGLMDVLSLADVIDEVSVTSESHVIMDYLVYGLTDVTMTTDTVNGYTRYTATYNPLSGTAYTVNVLVDSSDNIFGIYDTDDNNYSTDISATLATPVTDMNSRMNGLMDTITIGELMDTTGSTFLGALSGSTINSLEQDIENLAMQEVFYSDIYEQTAASADKNITMDGYDKVVYESIDIENETGTYYVYDDSYSTFASTSNSSTIVNALKDGTLYWVEKGDTTYYQVISVEGYYRVVYESIENVTGTYYVYDSTYSTLTSTSDSSTIASALENETLYWVAENDTTYYQVVSFDETYLYFDSSFEYKEEISGNKGHIDTYESTYGILYTYGSPSGTWYFMLYSTYTDSDGNSYLAEHVYSVDEIENLMENATENIGSASLRSLYEAGILEDNNGNIEDNLKIKISKDTLNKAYYGDAEEKYTYTSDTTLGDLNIEETLDVFVYIIGVYNNLGN